jgi:hypothetical protein
MVITHAEGQLFTWGDGVHGRLGHGDMEPCPEPRLVLALQHRRVLHVACGHYHSAAICVDASTHLAARDRSLHGRSGTHADLGAHELRYLYTWGGCFEAPDGKGSLLFTSNHGCLGLPGLQQHQGTLKPHAVELADVHDVACGMNFTVAVDGAGSVFQMGSMLHCGPVDGAEWEAATAPTRVRGALDGLVAKQVTAGRAHACVAATKDGGSWSTHENGVRPNRLVTWGNNAHCQLGRCSPDWEAGNGAADGAVPIGLRLVWVTPEVMADRQGAPVHGIAASGTATIVVLAAEAAAAAPRAPRRARYRGSLQRFASTMMPLSRAPGSRNHSQALRPGESVMFSLDRGSPSLSAAAAADGLRSGYSAKSGIEASHVLSKSMAAENPMRSSNHPRDEAWRGNERPERLPRFPPASPLLAPGRGGDDVDKLASRVAQLERLVAGQHMGSSLHGPAKRGGANLAPSARTQGECSLPS